MVSLTVTVTPIFTPSLNYLSTENLLNFSKRCPISRLLSIPQSQECSLAYIMCRAYVFLQRNVHISSSPEHCAVRNVAFCLPRLQVTSDEEIAAGRDLGSSLT